MIGQRQKRVKPRCSNMTSHSGAADRTRTDGERDGQGPKGLIAMSQPTAEFGRGCGRHPEAVMRHARLHGVAHGLRSMKTQGAHAPTSFIALIVFSTPRILITRLRLYASTCWLISVATCALVLIRKWVAPIQCLSVTGRRPTARPRDSSNSCCVSGPMAGLTGTQPTEPMPRQTGRQETTS